MYRKRKRTRQTNNDCGTSQAPRPKRQKSTPADDSDLELVQDDPIPLDKRSEVDTEIKAFLQLEFPTFSPAAVLGALYEFGGEYLNQEYKGFRQAAAYIRKHPSLVKQLQSAWEKGAFGRIRRMRECGTSPLL